jgi:hypothetical protein
MNEKEKILEEIRTLESLMEGRMTEHHRLMEIFISRGDHNAKENADRILHVWHKYKNELAELKEKLNPPG